VGRLPSAISPKPSANAAAAPLPEKRVAILGCGYTGRFEHGPGFARLPGMSVVGVCDVRPERATLLGSTLGCPSFTDAAELLRSVRPELVVNCTREWQHRDTTLMAFDAGADVFCEKIMAESLASGEAMVRAARERGRVLGVNFNWRYLPGVQRLRQLRDSGELGRLRMLRVFAHAWVSHHALDLVRYLGGSIRSVSATVLDEPATRGLADWNRYVDEMIYMPTIYSLVALQTVDDVGVSLSSSELPDPTGLLLSLDAVFQEGTVTLSGILDHDGVGTLTASARKKIDLRLDRGGGPAGFALTFQRSIEAFATSYRSGAPLPTSGEDALEVMRVENAIVRSHASGTRVLL
jgi:predicted dehydrogenase